MTVPITIITGFLGAGKTTLLQYILRAHHGRKILVIQNEFSDEMGIESPQLVDDKGNVIPDMYEVANGCMCCSVRDSLIGTLEGVLKNNPGRFDHVIVETSGVADPQRVISLFWMDSELGSDVHLDGVITVVDAFNINRYLKLTKSQVEDLLSKRQQATALITEIDQEDRDIISNLEMLISSDHEIQKTEESMNNRSVSTLVPLLAQEAFKQIASANVILLNKCDLVTKSQSNQIDHISSMLKLINPFAMVLLCERGHVPLDQLLDLNALSINSTTITDWVQSLTDSEIIKRSSIKSNNHSLSSPHSHTCSEQNEFNGNKETIIPVAISACNCFITAIIRFQLSSTPTIPSSLDSGATLSTLLSSSQWTSISTTNPFPIRSTSKWDSIIGSLVWKYDRESLAETCRYGDIYRYKGLFLVADDSEHVSVDAFPKILRLAALQGVGEIFEIKPVHMNSSCIERLVQIGSIRQNLVEQCFEFINKLLFIGNQLNVKPIEERLLKIDHS